MRRLAPDGTQGDVDLVACYAYPPDQAWVRANMVSSLDGSAVLAGRSGGLSGPGDKRIFGVLRGLCDVVLVGAGTARMERYRAPRAKPEYAALRARTGRPAAPALAVVSRRLDLDLSSELFVGGGVQRTIVVTCEASDPQARAALADVADVVVAGEAAVDLASALDLLVDRGLRRVLCEGGPTLLADIVAAGRLDELCLTLAPRLVAGPGPRILAGPALADPPVLRLGHLLEEDDALFGRYLCGPHHQSDDATE